MPTIACPKCQTKYKLPDSALGKAVKCQKCGVGFRTRAPQPAGQAAGNPAQQKAAAKTPGRPANSPEELARMGIDGPLKRQADIFSAPPPPQRSNPLGNFALEDPGFANLDAAREEAREETQASTGAGMESILANPYASPTTKGGKTSSTKKSKKEGPDVSGYSIPRAGMWMVYISWIVMMVIMIIGYLLSWFPLAVIQVMATLGPTFGMIFFYGIAGLFCTALLMVLIGQVLCIFSPNKDEKIFAGLAVGSIVGAVLVPVIGFLLIGVAVASSDVNEEMAMETGAMFGLAFLSVLIVTYLLILGNMFFFIAYFIRLGKNIKSKKLAETGKVAMISWILAIVIAVVGAIAVVVLTVAFPDRVDMMAKTISITSGINTFVGWSVMGALITMMQVAIKKTKVRTAS